MLKLIRAALAALSLCLSLPALAAEGMYTLDKLPQSDLAKRGFKPDAAWVDHVMQASARLAGGCSGSFVSKDGLVLTNHHCVHECVQQLSTAEKDFVKTGFLAKTREEEVRCPEVEINRLEKITDVTAGITAATKGKSGEAFASAQKAEQAKLEASCAASDKDKTRCEVVELYHGGAYHLYQYHRFQDVRLAFAPELAIAFFGGDPDNFNFPRYDLDMGMLRVYENGAPAKLTHYFPLKAAGPEENELVFVTGHPGSTQRQLTVAQLEFLRDMALPQRLFVASEFRGLLSRYRSEGQEQARIGQSDLFSVENSIKARKGMLEALQDPEVFAVKRRQESELRAWVAKNPKRRAQYGDAWDAIAKSQTTLRNIYWTHRLVEGGQGFNSRYFQIARALLRGAAERPKANAERLKEFGDARLPEQEQELFSTAPIYPDYEKLTLAFSLTKLRELLGADDPLVKQVLGKESPEAFAARLIDATQLADVAARKALWTGGAAALDASKDPFITLARLVDAPARAVRKTFEDEVEAVEQKNAEKIAGARFAMLGSGVYPDATFTLRLSYGEVKGWPEKGRPVAPFTDFAGAFERHTGSDPFALPESWFKAKPNLNLAQRYNLVSSNDIIGGNSGSPMINRNAEVVGLVFDGNIRSLGGAYWFDERVNRTVAVHSGAMLEALRKIYSAGFLADEISGK